MMPREYLSWFVQMVALLMVLVTHEWAHGVVALWNGDATAKEAGRLSLNPLVHLSLWGTLCMVIAHFGWAKPVPVNPYRFRNQKRGMFFVSSAGVALNFLTAVLATLCLRWIPISWLQTTYWGMFLYYLSMYGFVFAFFNLLPIPPLDGSKMIQPFLPTRWQIKMQEFEQIGWILLIFFLLSGAFDRTVLQWVPQIQLWLLTL